MRSKMIGLAARALPDPDRDGIRRRRHRSTTSIPSGCAAEWPRRSPSAGRTSPAIRGSSPRSRFARNKLAAKTDASTWKLKLTVGAGDGRRGLSDPRSDR